MAVPDSSSLEAWLSQATLEMYQKEHFAGASSFDPYEHHYFPDFFRKEVFEQLQEYCFGLNEILREGELPWVTARLVLERDVISFFYGPEFRAFVRKITGKKLVRKATFLPKFVVMEPDCPGIPVHTDVGSEYPYAMFVYMSNDWKEVSGGQLELYRQRGDGSLELSRSIEPTANTLVIARLGEKCYHRVAPTKNEWIRTNILIGWGER